MCSCYKITVNTCLKAVFCYYRDIIIYYLRKFDHPSFFHYRTDLGYIKEWERLYQTYYKHFHANIFLVGHCCNWQWSAHSGYVYAERLAFHLHGICWIILPNGVACLLLPLSEGRVAEWQSPSSHLSDWMIAKATFLQCACRNKQSMYTSVSQSWQCREEQHNIWYI